MRSRLLSIVTLFAGLCISSTAHARFFYCELWPDDAYWGYFQGSNEAWAHGYTMFDIHGPGADCIDLTEYAVFIVGCNDPGSDWGSETEVMWYDSQEMAEDDILFSCPFGGTAYALHGGSDFAVDCYVCDEYEEGGDDFDWDGVPDEDDNCPDIYNPDQSDWDYDWIGDVCDDDEDDEDDDDDDDDGDDGFPESYACGCTDGYDDDPCHAVYTWEDTYTSELDAYDDMENVCDWMGLEYGTCEPDVTWAELEAECEPEEGQTHTYACGCVEVENDYDACHARETWTASYSSQAAARDDAESKCGAKGLYVGTCTADATWSQLQADCPTELAPPYAWSCWCGGPDGLGDPCDSMEAWIVTAGQTLDQASQDMQHQCELHQWPIGGCARQTWLDVLEDNSCDPYKETSFACGCAAPGSMFDRCHPLVPWEAGYQSESEANWLMKSRCQDGGHSPGACFEKQSWAGLLSECASPKEGEWVEIDSTLEYGIQQATWHATLGDTNTQKMLAFFTQYDLTQSAIQAVALEELELPELASIALELIGVFGDFGDGLSLQAMIEKYDAMGDDRGVTVVHYREQTTWSITNTFTLTLAGGDDAGTAIGSWSKTVPTGNF